LLVARGRVHPAVLRVGRIDLVGDRGRPRLALDGALSEIPVGDVKPHVPVQIQQDVVDAADGVEQGCEVITGVRFATPSRRSAAAAMSA